MPIHQTVYSLTRTRPDGSLSESRGTGKLTRTVLPQASAYAMIRRRPDHGGTLEKAAAMANQPHVDAHDDSTIAGATRLVSTRSSGLW